MNEATTDVPARNQVLLPSVKNFLQGSSRKLLIGGKWVPAKSGKVFETINPANEEVLALVAEGDKADVDEAVKAARRAFENGLWSTDGATRTHAVSTCHRRPH